jgi:Undecaprenyl-phosphate glucose phosphotransferase
MNYQKNVFDDRASPIGGVGDTGPETGNAGSEAAPQQDFIIPIVPGGTSGALKRATHDATIETTGGARFSASILAGIIAFSDLIAVWFSGILIYLGYLELGVHPVSLYLVAMFLGSAGLLAAGSASGVYTDVATEAPATQTRRALVALAIVYLALVTIAFALKISEEYSRIWTFSWFTASAVLICAIRYASYAIVHRLARRGLLTRTAVILGAGTQGERLATALRNAHEPWLRVVGFFDDRDGRVASSVAGYPVLGGLDDLIAFGRNRRCDDVLVSLPWSAEGRIRDILQRLNVLPVCVRLAPDLVSFGYSASQCGHYAGLSVLNVIRNPLRGWRRMLKALEDRLLSVILLTVLAPLMALIALLVRLESAGPVLFRQRRLGFNNRVIQVLKFRTMYTNMQDADAERLTTPDDPRVTRVGAFLRRTSLDELPQLVNVLRGEMSLVGPRPHALKAGVSGKLYDQLVGDYAVRHKMKPGITGWAQVNGWRGETNTREKIEKRVEYDIYYIQNWSLWFDLRILLRTLRVLIGDRHAY